MATILVVDSSVDARDALLRLLGRQHQVEVADGAADGLARIARRPPDLVIAEVTAGTDGAANDGGYELARRIRADPVMAATRVVLAATGPVHQSVLDEATACGADRVIAKPFDADQVHSAVEETVGAGAAEHEQLRVLTESLAAKIDELNAANEELHRSEDRFRKLLELAPAAIIAVDTEGRVTLANALAENAFGYTRAEMVGQPIEMLVPDDLRTTHIRHRADYMRSPSVRPMGVGRDLEARRKDGSRFPVTVSLSILGEGEDLVVLAAVLDISERVQEEQARARLEASLAQAARLESVGQLAGGIAHDFNNLLAVIINYAEFVSRAAPPDLRGDVAEIQVAGRRAADLVRQLLLFSRGQPAAAQRLQLEEVLDGLRELLERTIGEHVTMTIDAAANIPAVLIDRSKLEQVVVNLVVNARDAMPKGGPIDIEIGVVEADTPARPVRLASGRYVRLGIRDAGTGMSQAVRDQAFDPFFTTKPRGKGTGLGLATVYGIVTEAGGHVGLTSDVDRGTQVSVYLPAVPDEAEQIAASATRATPGGAGETVLVVEDEPAVLEIARRILERNQYAVVLAGSPADALEMSAAFEHAPALVLSDVVMPGMSGPDLIEQLRGRWPHLPVLFMSGYAEDVAPQSLAGFDVVGKPFTATELLARIRSLLERAS
ncbi:MAG: ATP-binding response regulator [Acidimicrobiales bacterium]